MDNNDALDHDRNGKKVHSWSTRITSFFKRPSISAAMGALVVVCVGVVIIVVLSITQSLFEKAVTENAELRVQAAAGDASRLIGNQLKRVTDATLPLAVSSAYNAQTLPTEEDQMTRSLGIIAPLPSNTNLTNGLKPEISYDYFVRVPGAPTVGPTIRYSDWRRRLTEALISGIEANQGATGISTNPSISILSTTVTFDDGSQIRLARSYLTDMVSDSIVVGSQRLQRDTTLYLTSTFQSTRKILNVKYSVSSADSMPQLDGWYQQTAAIMPNDAAALFFHYDVLTERPVGIAIRPVFNGSKTIGRSMVLFDVAPVARVLKGSDFFLNNAALNGMVQSYAIIGGYVAASTLLTSAADWQASYRTIVVPDDYVMTSQDFARRCFVDSVAHTKSCPINVLEHPDPVLSQVYQKLLEKKMLYAESGWQKSVEVTVNGERYFAVYTIVQGAPSVETSAIICTVPASAIESVFKQIRTIVIAIAVCVTVASAAIFAFLARWMLRPIADIACRMEAAAYLQDEETRDVNVDDSLDLLEKKKLAKDLLTTRDKSMWAEVRAIQIAYWSVHDQVQRLKAYIPEHVIEEAQKERRESHRPPNIIHSVDSMDVISLDFNGHWDKSVEMQPIDGGEESMSVTSQLEGATESLSIGTSTEEKRLIRSPPPVAKTAQKPGNNWDRPILHQKSSTKNPLTASQFESNEAAQTADGPKAVDLHASQANEERDTSIYFCDSSLIDREITVVFLNINRFHEYVLRRRHPSAVSVECSEFITYLQGEAKRFGGVLESFNGDKIWFSFNATSKCTFHQLSAAYFAYSVLTAVNRMALRRQKSRAELPDARFGPCVHGVSCGVATSKALVGPIGSKSMKRHCLISNAMSEAQALERMSLPFYCSVLVTRQVIEAIGGYFQYQFVDAAVLPGLLVVKKGELVHPRRYIASLRGPMLGPEADFSRVSRWLTPREGPSRTIRIHASDYDFVIEQPGVGAPLILPVPTINMYEVANNFFISVLAGDFSSGLEHRNALTALVTATEPDHTVGESFEQFEDRRSQLGFSAAAVGMWMDSGRREAMQYESALGTLHGYRVRSLQPPRLPKSWVLTQDTDTWSPRDQRDDNDTNVPS